MMNLRLRKQKVADARIKGNVSKKTELRLFIGWALPALVLAIAAAATPVYSVGVATSGPKSPLASSSSSGAADVVYDKSRFSVLRFLQGIDVVVHEDHDDHHEEEHEDELHLEVS